MIIFIRESDCLNNSCFYLEIELSNSFVVQNPGSDIPAAASKPSESLHLVVLFPFANLDVVCFVLKNQ